MSTSKAETVTKYAERLTRRNEAWRLRCQGLSQHQIANSLDVSQATISRDLKWATDRAIRDLSSLVQQTKIEQVFQLETVIAEAMNAWQKSKNPSKTVSQRKGGKKGFGSNEVTTTTVAEQIGDARYLSVAMKAMADIRAIIGAEALTDFIIGTGDLDAAIEQELARMAGLGEETIPNVPEIDGSPGNNQVQGVAG